MEMLVVVAIMGVVMTMAIPAIYRQLHPDSMQKAVTDIMEACSFARAQAILSDTPMEVQFRPFDRTIRVAASARSGGSSGSLFSPSVSGDAWRMDDLARGGARSASSPLSSPSVSGDEWRMDSRGSASAGSWSGKLSDQIKIEMLDVNFFEFKDEELAQVRFYPNGTSDEFTIVLNKDNHEWRKITLEVVTGLADVQTDPNRFLR